MFFIINVGIGIYFTYYKYLSCNKANVPKYDYTYQTTIHSKNGNYYFYGDIINIKYFHSNLLKIDKKSH